MEAPAVAFHDKIRIGKRYIKLTQIVITKKGNSLSFFFFLWSLLDRGLRKYAL